MILLTSPVSMFGQFEVFLDLNGFNNEGEEIREVGNHFVVSGWYNDFPIGSLRGYQSLSIDQSGAPIDTAFFFLDSIALNPWGMHPGVSSFGNFYVGFYGVKIGTNTGNAIVSRHGPFGDTISTQIVDSINSGALGIHLFSDNEIYTIGPRETQSLPNSVVRINQLDSALNTIEFVDVREQGVDLNGSTIIVTPSKEKYMVIWQQIPPNTLNPFLYKADSNNNVLFRKNLGVGGDDDFLNLIGIDNNSLYFQGVLDTPVFIGGSTENPIVMKTDLNGNKIWTHYFDSREVFDIWGHHFIDSTSTLLVCGSSTLNEGWLAAIDSSGDVLWQRFFPVDSSNMTILKDVIIAEDGFIWCTGVARFFDNSQSVFRNQTWVLKLDSLGCLIPGCSTTSVPQIENEIPIFIYPNPSTGDFAIEFPQGLQEAGQIRIYNTSGVLEHQDQLLSGTQKHLIKTELASGVYIIQVFQGDDLLATRKIRIAD